MRARWILVPVIVCQGTIVVAQTPSLRVGLLAGMNQAHVSGLGVSDISNHTGGAFGAYVVAPFPNAAAWSFQTGAVLSMKGWERDEPGTRDLAVVKLTYLEIPVLLRYDIAARERAGGFVYGGAGLGFRTACSIGVTVHSTGRSQTASCSEIETASNGAAAFESFDAGAIIGGGLRFGIGSTSLVLTAQYEHGLTQVQKSIDAKNRTLTFGAGIELPVHRQ